MKKTNKFQKTSSNWTLIGLCIGSALVVLDANVLNVALPEIKTAFSALATDFLWILNAYTLVFAVGLLPAGIFASRFGGGIYFFIRTCHLWFFFFSLCFNNDSEIFNFYANISRNWRKFVSCDWVISD
nr:hypothetical protein [Tetragenococcus halophilus]